MRGKDNFVLDPSGDEDRALMSFLAFFFAFIFPIGVRLSFGWAFFVYMLSNIFVGFLYVLFVRFLQLTIFDPLKGGFTSTNHIALQKTFAEGFIDICTNTYTLYPLSRYICTVTLDELYTI